MADSSWDILYNILVHPVSLHVNLHLVYDTLTVNYKQDQKETCRLSNTIC
jgi:hypothetical protein